MGWSTELADFRAQYWIAAEEQLRESQKHETLTLGYWANLAVGLVNAVMAALPDSVVPDVLTEQERRRRLGELDQKRVQKKIRDDLRAK